jgi:hypothetical protein
VVLSFSFSPQIGVRPQAEPPPVMEEGPADDALPEDAPKASKAR